MVQCRLDSKERTFFTDCVVSRVDFSLCDVTESSKPVTAKDGVGATMIFLATIFVQKRYPYDWDGP